MAKDESRFGFGQLVGSVGVALLGIGVTQPWLRLDLVRAFDDALAAKGLDATRAGEILFVGQSRSVAPGLQNSPQVQQLAEQLGIGQTGWEQNRYVAAAVIIAALIALFGIIRSVLAKSAWGARANSPLLALAGLVTLVLSAVQLWVLAPAPRAAMRPELGLWLMTAGAGCLLLGALTLGSNRRRPLLDEIDHDEPRRSFDNTEHLAYSHGAWVPRAPDKRA